MSDTPKTDVIYRQFGPQFSPAPMAYFSLCRELERQNATLREALTECVRYTEKWNAALPRGTVERAKDALTHP